MKTNEQLIQDFLDKGGKITKLKINDYSDPKKHGWNRNYVNTKAIRKKREIDALK